MESAKEVTRPRAPSRSSTTSSHSHQYHHAHCGPGSNAVTPVSSLLKERLQQKRQTDKSSRESMTSSTGDIRDKDRVVQSSPIRRSTTATGRLPRSDSNEEVRNGMAAKETEQAVSSLHKQNFDLKLELFHRRERQTALEKTNRDLEVRNTELELHLERLEAHADKLQEEKTEMSDLHDTLAAELDKRDKALGEAVDMIITLEARVEALMREREMVRSVEADSHYRPLDSATISQPDKPELRQRSHPEKLRIEDVKTLDRMPSFLSERSERTANLRNVVLGNGFLHSRKVSESSVDPSEINRIASPSLSVLSESSFVSVYGKTKAPEQQFDERVNRLPNPGQPITQGSSIGRKSSSTSSQTPKEAWKGGFNLSAQMQSLNNIIDVTSPLQQIESLERKCSVDATSRPSTSSRSRTVDTPPPGRTRSQARTKQEKREALRKVMTTSPGSRDGASIHMLPPTPDTTSSSMLRRYQNSNDTFSREPHITPQDSFQHDDTRGATAEFSNRISANVSSFEPQGIPGAKFTRCKNHLVPYSGQEARTSFNNLAHTLPPRPRSAGDTTVSRHDEWDSDSDSDGGADAHSQDSKFDYWMNESRGNEKFDDIRSSSPDLFSFPIDSSGWETDVIFGVMRGAGFLGSPVPGLKRDPLDEMAGAALGTPQTAVFQPPAPAEADGGVMPPNRRSSLHARTGSVTGRTAAPAGNRIRKDPVRGNSVSRLMGRKRSNSIDSASVGPVPRLQFDGQVDAVAPSRRNQYPPLSGQPTKSRGLSGLHSLFRRSGSMSGAAIDDTPSNSVERSLPSHAPPSRTRQEHPAGRCSVPPPATMPWRPPMGVDDELTSATPPPIMRNRGQPQNKQLGTEDAQLTDPTTPRKRTNAEGTLPNYVVGHEQPVEKSDTAKEGRRRWLGLGRRSSMQNRD